MNANTIRIGTCSYTSDQYDSIFQMNHDDAETVWVHFGKMHGRPLERAVWLILDERAAADTNDYSV